MKGIRQRGNTLEIYFNFQGKKRFIKVESIEQGIALRNLIIQQINNQTLTLELLEEITNPKTFQTVSNKYLKYNQSNNQTKQTYYNILKHHWFPYLGNIPIKSITTEMILELIIEKELSNKYINQILIPLRGVFDTAILLKYIKENPTDNIKNKKLQLEQPDPFNRDEMETILNWLKRNSSKTHYLFYEISFWTGLRPSELIALQWKDITDDTIYIHKSRVKGIEKQTTKTKNTRTVLLNPRSKQAIEQLDKTNNYLITTTNKQPFNSNHHLRESFKLALQANQIRERPSYNTRHTYATMLLMSGANPAFVANQLGHSITTLMSRYARWLNSDMDKLELNKLVTSIN